jgi:hypothetical protein
MTSHPIKSGATCALLLIGTLLLLAACAAGPNELVDTGPDPAGLLVGAVAGIDQPDHLYRVVVHHEGEHLRGAKQRQLVRLRIHAWCGLRV